MCVIILHEKTRKGEIRLQIHQVDESVPRRQRCDSEAAVVCTPANSVRTAFVLDLYYTPNPMQTNQCRFINELSTVGFRFRPLHTLQNDSTKMLQNVLASKHFHSFLHVQFSSCPRPSVEDFFS